MQRWFRHILQSRPLLNTKHNLHWWRELRYHCICYVQNAFIHQRNTVFHHTIYIPQHHSFKGLFSYLGTWASQHQCKVNFTHISLRSILTTPSYLHPHRSCPDLFLHMDGANVSASLMLICRHHHILADHFPRPYCFNEYHMQHFYNIQIYKSKPLIPLYSVQNLYMI